MTVYAPRNVRKSVIENLATLFADGSKLVGGAFNIYYDADMQAGTEPTRPGIFILNFGNLFETKHLPAIVVLPSFRHMAMELGNRWGHCDLVLHIFGRTLDEADDVAGAIMRYISDWTMYEYATGSAVAVGGTPIDGEWAMEYVPLSTEFEQEGTFDNWVALSCSFPVPYFT